MKLKATLSSESLYALAESIHAYRQSLGDKVEEVLDRTVTEGEREAINRVRDAAAFEHDLDGVIVVDHAPKKRHLSFEGKDVAFIEFGSGVYYNGNESYPGERPEGVVGIGEYGEGFGKRRKWAYIDEGGEKHLTRGIFALAPLFYASREMENALARIAREVFDD